MRKAASELTRLDETKINAEVEGVLTAPNELKLADEDLRTRKTVQITHATKGRRPTLIKDNKVPN